MYSLLILYTAVFFSCSSPLDKPYDKVSRAKGILDLKEIISKDELNELKDYILLSSQFGVYIVGKTYNELLYDIEISKNNEKKRQNDYARVNI